MRRTGTLTTNGVSSLNGVALAIQGNPNPFAAANNFLADRGLGEGDLIWVDAQDGLVGAVPVWFITNAGPA